jgi:hypothetical protein
LRQRFRWPNHGGGVWIGLRRDLFAAGDDRKGEQHRPAPEKRV